MECSWPTQRPVGIALREPEVSRTARYQTLALQIPRLSMQRPDRREHTSCRSRPASLYLPSPHPGPNKAMGAKLQPKRCQASKINGPDLDFTDVVHAQPKLRRIFNMPGLADEPVDARILVVAVAGFHVSHGTVPNRCGVLGLALAVNHVKQQTVDGHGVGAEYHLLREKAEFSCGREWPAVPHAAQAVHDFEHRARAQRLDGGQRPDERIRVGLESGVRARHIRKISVGDVLETAGDARG